jgi:hypothetical protein
MSHLKDHNPRLTPHLAPHTSHLTTHNPRLTPHTSHLNQRLGEDVAADAGLVRAYEEQVSKALVEFSDACISRPVALFRVVCANDSALQLRSDLQRGQGQGRGQ